MIRLAVDLINDVASGETRSIWLEALFLNTNDHDLINVKSFLCFYPKLDTCNICLIVGR